MKLLYFPLYIQDFTVGTMDMSAEEVGGYVRLLIYQWDKGAIPSDPKELLKISKMKSKSLENVMKKFIHDGENGLKNVRLEKERNLITEKYSKLQQNGAKGGRPSKTKRFQDENQLDISEKPNGFENKTKAKPNGGEIQIQIQNKIQSNTSVLQGAHENLDRPSHAPTRQAVEEIFHRLGHPELAQGFFDYYEGLGWMAGQTKIVNAAAFANKWVSNPAAQKEISKVATGRRVIMETDGREVIWTEEQYKAYKSNPNTSGFHFVRYE